MKLRELLTDESKWTQKAYARDKDGKPTGALSPTAVCWCLDGAIRKCCPESLEGRIEIFSKLLDKTRMGIIQFNDTHTFAEIKTILDELDI